MKYPKRIYYTETDKALMWDRWEQGESLHSICAALWSQSFFYSGDTVSHRRYPPCGSTPFESITDTGGARRDFTWTCIVSIASLDCVTFRSFNLDGQP